LALEPENVQSYPRPPRLERVAATLEVWLGGHLIARTDAGWRVCETHHPPTYYFPPGDVVDGVLSPARGTSFCEWKGRAAYWDVRAGSEHRPRAAWSYPAPTADFAALGDHLAFYPGQMDACRVDGIEAAPQPGGFYGGWVTPNLTGRIKGAPGTEGW
jgi:uncharacterized protein (DUF427 family)